MAHIIRITVGGIPYSISCDDDEAYVKSVAGELEHRMNVLAKEKPFLSTTMVAVMTALELADKERKASIEVVQQRLEIKKLTEELTCAKMEAEMYKKNLIDLGLLSEDE